ncbi:hypothetical protein [Metabacillus fastidiosus]|uniref:hypothetical protein n=1 Tax=Metabacillus fastidiosus TaxID=1458 RepID=UPI002E1D6325|nr:hypothetical protein [Metabacillus fastidiosus]
MCKLCNGKYVIYEEEAATATFVPCPNCTPISKEEARLRKERLDRRIAEAYVEMGMEDAS